jgi:hypothetical protein
MVLFSIVLASPMLGSMVAFTAVTSIATIGIYISYGTHCSMACQYYSEYYIRVVLQSVVLYPPELSIVRLTFDPTVNMIPADPASDIYPAAD